MFPVGLSLQVFDSQGQPLRNQTVPSSVLQSGLRAIWRGRIGTNYRLQLTELQQNRLLYQADVPGAGVINLGIPPLQVPGPVKGLAVVISTLSPTGQPNMVDQALIGLTDAPPSRVRELQLTPETTDDESSAPSPALIRIQADGVAVTEGARLSQARLNSGLQIDFNFPQAGPYTLIIGRAGARGRYAAIYLLVVNLTGGYPGDIVLPWALPQENAQVVVDLYRQKEVVPADFLARLAQGPVDISPLEANLDVRIARTFFSVVGS